MELTSYLFTGFIPDGQVSPYTGQHGVIGRAAWQAAADPGMVSRRGVNVADERRILEELSPQESMRLLASVSLGRIVFTARALPAIRPVSHLVDGDSIIIRTDHNAAITSELRAEAGTIVAYEADAFNSDHHLGWSVVVVGAAHRVIDPDEASAYRRMLRPWISGDKDQVIAIHADMVTGFRLVAARPGDAVGAVGGDFRLP
jgi:hypothetical protein